MDKYCIICNDNGKYKCPTCLVYYCSVQCCRKHRQNECTIVSKSSASNENTQLGENAYQFPTADTISMEKLMLLRNNDKLKDLLCNPHLRNLLLTVNGSKNPEEIMQKAMQEPIFVEFADVCLKIVEPEKK